MAAQVIDTEHDFIAGLVKTHVNILRQCVCSVKRLHDTGVLAEYQDEYAFDLYDHVIEDLLSGTNTPPESEKCAGCSCKNKKHKG